MRSNLVVYEGTIANADSRPFLGQVVIDKFSGIILEVLGANNNRKYDADVKYGDNCIIFPGMGDIHIHAREDETGKWKYKEDFTTAGNAGLKGGLVLTAIMPNTPKSLIDEQTYQWNRNRIHQINHPVSMFNYVGIGKGTRPIGEPGEHFYKAFFGKSVGNLTFENEEELFEALKNYDGHNVSFHVEYEPIVLANSRGLNHSNRRPVECVERGLELLLPMIEDFRLQAKLCHWSTGGESFEMIEDHRERAAILGLPYTTIEVSPLHLLFDTSMTDADPSLWLKIQMNPAIQTLEHRRALIDGLRSGFIDHLATDHAPHTENEKYAAFSQFVNILTTLNSERFKGENINVKIGEFIRETDLDLFHKTCCENGTSGAPWLDTFSNVCTWLMQEEGFTAQDIARVASYNPGNFINPFISKQFPNQNFGKGFGKIEPGYVGSLTVINTQKPYEVNRADLQTKVGWSPLEGRTFSGGLEAVIIKGEDMTGRFL